jgi:thiamine-monophosphate kinase
LDEFELIRRFFDRQLVDESVVAGIGDDGAVFRARPSHELVTVMDTMVAGVHFPEFLDAGDIGYRAVAVNLSDIAAMAASPRWMTLALTLQHADGAWLEAFAEGLFTAAGEHDVALVGGDTTRGAETVVTVQITGEVKTGTATLRSGAKAGDAIYVSGTMGDAAAGLSVLQSGAPANEDIDYLVRRFRRPTARVGLAQAIATHATAAIDISDGLFADAEKLLHASGVSGSIEVSEVPISAPLRRTMANDDALGFALAGGDDYELCFTTSVNGDQFDEIAAGFDTTLTRIGTVAEGAGLSCTKDGVRINYTNAGYRHFGD